MREADAQAVVLVRAFEEEDPEGRLLSVHARASATEAARAASAAAASDGSNGGGRAASGTAEDFMARRANTLMDALEPQVPVMRGLLSGTRMGVSLGPAVVTVAGAVGLFSNALGPDRAINVLSAPMLAIVAWNLGLYGLLLVVALRPARQAVASSGTGSSGTGSDARTSASTRTPGSRAPGSTRMSRLVAAMQHRALSAPVGTRGRDGAVIGAAVARYFSLWQPLGASLLACRVRRLLHLGALALAAGAVGGMYMRGLVLAYEATWESTFLEASQVQTLLDVVLAPAAALIDTTVPAVAPLQSPALGPAALWIHLWAATAVVFVVVPRFVLVLAESRRITRLSADITPDLDAGYYRRLLAPARGDAEHVVVQPYSYRLGQRERDTLRALLHDFFGARAEVRWDAVVEYGGEAGAVSPEPVTGSLCRVLLFGLSQSPESEVHGAHLSAAARPGDADDRLLVVVDASTFRERLGDGPRLDERRRAWDRIVREAGLVAVHVDLGRPPEGDLLAEMAVALWPATNAVGGGGGGAASGGSAGGAGGRAP